VGYTESVARLLGLAVNDLRDDRVDVFVDEAEKVGMAISFNKTLLKSLFSHFFNDSTAINPKLININIRHIAF
jgi:hypothetical protein